MATCLYDKCAMGRKVADNFFFILSKVNFSFDMESLKKSLSGAWRVLPFLKIEF